MKNNEGNKHRNHLLKIFITPEESTNKSDTARSFPQGLYRPGSARKFASPVNLYQGDENKSLVLTFHVGRKSLNSVRQSLLFIGLNGERMA